MEFSSRKECYENIYMHILSVIKTFFKSIARNIIMGLQSKAYFPKIGYIISNSCVSDVVFVRCEEKMTGFS